MTFSIVCCAVMALVGSVMLLILVLPHVFSIRSCIKEAHSSGIQDVVRKAAHGRRQTSTNGVFSGLVRFLVLLVTEKKEALAGKTTNVVTSLNDSLSLGSSQILQGLGASAFRWCQNMATLFPLGGLGLSILGLSLSFADTSSAASRESGLAMAFLSSLVGITFACIAVILKSVIESKIEQLADILELVSNEILRTTFNEDGAAP